MATLALNGFIIIAALFCALYILTIPLSIRLPSGASTTLDGITTIDDAVDACLSSGLAGWGLVEHAQHIVARKIIYSRLNPWDSPSRAFERGMGYCLQSARALKLICDRLGIDARTEFALRCTFPAAVVDGIPQPKHTGRHAWLRVRIDGVEMDVDPASKRNFPGRINFELRSRSFALPQWAIPLLRVADIALNTLLTFKQMFFKYYSKSLACRL